MFFLSTKLIQIYLNPNLGEGEIILPAITPLCWFPLIYSETVKAVNLAFCSFQHHFIKNIHSKFGILNSPQSPDLGQNSVEYISDFCISDQSFTNKNCHNSRTNLDIDKKLGPVTKIDKTNTVTSKKFDDGFTSENCDFILCFEFLTNFQPSVNRIPDAWSIKITFSLTIFFYFGKPKNRTKKSHTQLSYYCFE